MRFDDQEACIRRVLPNLKTESRPTRNDNIVSFVIRQQAKVCLEHTVPVMDKVNLVTFAIAIKVMHLLCWPRHGKRHVLVKEQNLASQDGITAGRQRACFQMVMALHILTPLLQAHIHEFLDLFHARRWVRVIEVGVVARKALCPKEFLGVERAIRFTKLGVPLRWYLPQTMIGWHMFLLT